MVAHTHGCDQFHYRDDAPPDKHTLDNCPHVHAHTGGDQPHEHGVLPPWRERLAFLMQAPWIRPIKSDLRCDKVGVGGVKGRRCKNRAVMNYRPLAASRRVTKGNYCSTHPGWLQDENEMFRIKRWLKKNRPPWEN